MRGPHTGHEGWATVYTPVGYTLRADNILATIRSRVADTAASCSNVRLYESHAVTSIDRSHKLNICYLKYTISLFNSSAKH